MMCPSSCLVAHCNDHFFLISPICSSVDDELSALKKGMIKGASAPVAALPEGRPVKDAFDFELEELRKKARE